jgi:localization factor PodJL
LDAEAIAHHHEALREVAAHLAAKSEAVAQTIAPDTIFVEDIEAHFGRELNDPMDLPGDGDGADVYRLADDPFADMNSEPSAEEEDLFWSTGAETDRPSPLQNGVGAPIDDPRENDALGMDLGEPLSGYEDEEDYFPTSETKDVEDEVFDGGMDLNLDPPRKDDYLSHARRVAKAQSDAMVAEPARARQQKSSLRGFSSLVLWTAAGAVAAALAGGVYYYTEQKAAESNPSTPSRDALALPPDAAPGSIAESAAKTEAAPEAISDTADTPLSAAPAPAPMDAAPAEPAPAHAAPLHPTAAPASNATAPTLTEAAARGDRSAQYQLALQRFDEARPAQAIPLLKRAAEQGLAMAQYRLAKAYERGEGIAPSKDQARQWTERAALGGNARAMHDLGVYLASAQGAARVEARAVTGFKRAAERGLADSQFNVALMYLQGRGAAPDSAQAYYWFQVAAKAGDHDAAARAAMIERQLGASAKQVRARARTFSPRPMVAEANGVIDQSWSSAEQLQASAGSGPRT